MPKIKAAKFFIMSDCEPCFNLVLRTSRISTCPNFNRIESANVPSIAFAKFYAAVRTEARGTKLDSSVGS